MKFHKNSGKFYTNVTLASKIICQNNWILFKLYLKGIGIFTATYNLYYKFTYIITYHKTDAVI